jgi:hypothetical protein
MAQSTGFASRSFNDQKSIIEKGSEGWAQSKGHGNYVPTVKRGRGGEREKGGRALRCEM